jgi:hypothetical protein
MLGSTPFLQIKGTPASGKSELLRQMKMYLERLGWTVFSIKTWRRTKDVSLHSYLCEKLGTQHLLNLDSGTKKALLFDEGQMTYGDDELWNEFIKLEMEGFVNFKLVMACSYGLQSPESLALEPTPLKIPEDRTIQLFPIEGRPGLFFTEEEYAKVVRNHEIVTGLKVPPELKKCVWDLTCGHPGATDNMLDYILTSEVS